MKRKMKPDNKPPVLWQFSLSYFFILLIPVAMGIISYQNILDTTTKQTIYSNMLILKNSMSKFEGTLNSIEKYAQTLNQLTIFNSLNQTSGKDEIDILELKRATTSFPAFQDDNKYLNYYFYYDTRNQIAIAPNKGFINMGLFYGSFFDFGDMDFSEWQQRILNNNENNNKLVALNITSGQEESKLLYYQIPYIDRSAGVITGHLFFIINEAQVRNTLTPAFDLGAGFMYIMDENGDFLVTMERDGWTAAEIEDISFETNEGTVEKNVDGQKMMVSYLKSQDYGWTYVIAIPKSFLVSSVRGSLNLSILSTVFLGIVGALLIFAAYNYNKRPLLSIVDKMDPSEGAAKTGSLLRLTRNGLWYLAGSVSALVNNNEQLEKEIEKQQAQLREAFFIQLVSGELLNEDNLTERIAKYGVDAQGKRFRGVYMEFASHETGGVGDLDEIINEAIVTKTGDLIPCFWADQNHLTLLYMSGADSEPYRAFLKEIYFQIKDDYDQDVVFFIGLEYESLRSVHLSFSEARKLLVHRKNAISNIFFVNEYDTKDRAGYAYTSQDEEMLLDYANSGRFDEIGRILDRVYEMNFEKNTISAYMRDLLFSRMIGTLVCSPYGEMITISRHLPDTVTNEEFFAELLSQYRLICEANLVLMKEKQEDIKNQIIEYIDTHYMERSLSLKTLSVQFGMAESYLSTFIKQLIGETFSSYLENLRINQANLLLKDAALSITEVGFMVGYDSATSFGRAYKRVMGYSASQYRKINLSVC